MASDSKHDHPSKNSMWEVLSSYVQLQPALMTPDTEE
jgi:hypothetical protein